MTTTMVHKTYTQGDIFSLRVVRHLLREERVALREGYPRGKCFRHMIGCCLTPLGLQDMWVDLKITWEALPVE